MQGRHQKRDRHVATDQSKQPAADFIRRPLHVVIPRGDTFEDEAEPQYKKREQSHECDDIPPYRPGATADDLLTNNRGRFEKVHGQQAGNDHDDAVGRPFACDAPRHNAQEYQQDDIDNHD